MRSTSAAARLAARQQFLRVADIETAEHIQHRIIHHAVAPKTSWCPTGTSLLAT
jgi:hypothetical protein